MLELVTRVALATGIGVWALWLGGAVCWAAYALYRQYVKWRNRRMVKRVHRAQIKRTIRELCTHPIHASSDEEAIRLLTEM